MRIFNYGSVNEKRKGKSVVSKVSDGIRGTPWILLKGEGIHKEHLRLKRKKDESMKFRTGFTVKDQGGLTAKDWPLSRTLNTQHYPMSGST